MYTTPATVPLALICQNLRTSEQLVRIGLEALPKGHRVIGTLDFSGRYVAVAPGAPEPCPDILDLAQAALWSWTPSAQNALRAAAGSALDFEEFAAGIEAFLDREEAARASGQVAAANGPGYRVLTAASTDELCSYTDLLVYLWASLTQYAQVNLLRSTRSDLWKEVARLDSEIE